MARRNVTSSNQSSSPTSGRPSCFTTAALVGVPVGMGLLVVGELIDDDDFFGPGGLMAAFGALVLLVSLILACLVSVTRLLLTERGSLLQEALVAGGATLLPCLILSGQLLQSRALPRPDSLALCSVISPQFALIGTVNFVGWLAIFGWRVRRPAPSARQGADPFGVPLPPARNQRGG